MLGQLAQRRRNEKGMAVKLSGVAGVIGGKGQAMYNIPTHLLRLEQRN